MNVTMAERVRLPLVPLMVMFTELPGPGQLAPAMIVSVDVAVPFGFKVRVTGLIDHELQPDDVQAGADVLRETGPVKLLILETRIEAVPVAPGPMVRLLGLVLSAKSGPGQAATDGMRKLNRLY